MATIKDVAKLAGVSLGTVSNVLNGSKTVNSEIAKRVYVAMDELGYKPDAKARSLRSNKTTQLGIILPNILDDIYASIYYAVEKIAYENGYTLSLYTTNDNIKKEKEIVNLICQDRFAGIIVITCMPEDEAFEEIIKTGSKIVFIRRKPKKNYSFFGLNEKSIIKNCVIHMISEGKNKIAFLSSNIDFSNEKDCLIGYLSALKQSNISPEEHLIKHINHGKENAFRVATLWMQSSNPPDVIVTTCSEFAKGAASAIDFFKGVSKPKICYISNDSWAINQKNEFLSPIGQKYSLLAKQATLELIEYINTNKPIENIVLDSYEMPLDNTIPSFDYVNTKPLRVLMLDSAASYASQLMLQKICYQTKTNIEIDVFPYVEMHDIIASSEVYDVVQINIPWLREFAKLNKIINLNDYINNNPLVLRNFSEEIIKYSCKIDDDIYSVPFTMGFQTLFYRKDFFEDEKIQRLFYSKYKKDLNIPKNWLEYDAIARFFTKDLNADSPSKYGATIGEAETYSLYHLIPRIWELGGCIFDDMGKLSIDIDIWSKALEQHSQAFSYSSKNSVHFGWAEQAKEFCKGDVAMMAIYQSHFTDHQIKDDIAIKDQIGFAHLPNSRNILGGWVLGVSSNSKQIEKAQAFISCMCSSKNTIPYNILGGSMPGENAINSIELQDIYPWYPQTLNAMKYSEPMLGLNPPISQWTFEKIIGKIIYKYVLEKADARKTAEEICFKLQKFLSKAKGIK